MLIARKIISDRITEKIPRKKRVTRVTSEVETRDTARAGREIIIRYDILTSTKSIQKRASNDWLKRNRLLFEQNIKSIAIFK